MTILQRIISTALITITVLIAIPAALVGAVILAVGIRDVPQSVSLGIVAILWLVSLALVVATVVWLQLNRRDFGLHRPRPAWLKRPRDGQPSVDTDSASGR